MNTNFTLIIAGMILSTVVPLRLQAQPILTEIGDLVIGMEIQHLRVQPPASGAGDAGANVIWDFTAIGTSTDTIRQWIIHPDSSQFGSMFPEADIVELNSDGSRAFIEKGDADRVWGFLTSDGILLQYEDPYEFLSRPFTYQDSLSDTSSRHFMIGETNSLSGSGHTLTVADGWGTLLLPNGEYENALRLIYEQTYHDTDATSGLVTEVFTRSYAWYDDQHRSAIMKIDSTFINSIFFTDTIATTSYLIHETPVGVAEHHSPDPIRMYFMDEQLHLHGEFNAGEKALVMVLDGSGRLIEEQEGLVRQNGYHQVEFNDLSGGLLLINVYVGINGSIQQGCLKIIQ